MPPHDYDIIPKREYFTPNGVTGWWTSLPFIGIDLAPEAYDHDKAFFLGGGEREFHRANQEFRRDIRLTSKGRSLAVRWFIHWLAWSRFWAVEKFGRSHFYWTDDRNPRAMYYDGSEKQQYALTVPGQYGRRKEKA